jgi:lysyl-tRNA synthetase class 2
MNWQSSASLLTLRQRSMLLATAREFFGSRGLVEVETPNLVQAAVTDPHLNSIPLRLRSGERLFLHTSPEFHMKRLLAGGAPDIWQLGKVFRDGEAGSRHEPEFTLLEWYRHDCTLQQLVAETCELLAVLADAAERVGAPATITADPPRHWTYAALFLETLDIDPLAATARDLENRARALLGNSLGDDLCASLGSEPTLWLDLLMSHVVSRQLVSTGIAVVSGYPAAQAALARLDPADHRVAERFEVFCHGIEVANGYRELTDATEQRRRFEADRALRARLGLPDVEPDAKLLAAIEHGLPDCSGVAVGFDRVVMVLLGLRTLQEAVSFPTLPA